MGNNNETADSFYSKQIPNNNEKSKLLNEFKEYIEKETPIDFRVINGKIEVDNIGGFSDGIYKLKNYEIKTIDAINNLYIFKGDFKFKRKGLIYNKNVEFSFHYNNGNKLVIKYRGRFYKFYINNKTYTIKKPIYGNKKTPKQIYRRDRSHGGGIMIREEGATKIIRINNLKIKIKFKTD